MSLLSTNKLANDVLYKEDLADVVQPYDADTAKYDDTTANFTGTLQNGGSNVLVDTDVSNTLQPYSSTTADYADATANFTGTLQNSGSNVLVDLDVGVSVQAYDADIPTVKATTEEMELGLETTVRSMSPYNIKQAINIIGGSLLLVPTITSPTDGAIDFNGDITLTYNVTENYMGIQDYVIWELATDSDFTNIIASYSGSSNLTSWDPGSVGALQTVYVRVRTGSDNHLSSYSSIVSYTSPNIYVETPTITVTGSPIDVPETPILTLSAFSIFNGSDTHLNTDWQILNSGLDVIWESLADATNKLSITVPSGILSTATEYTFRGRQRSTNYGVSDWGSTLATTLNTFNIISGVQWNPSTDTYSRTGGGNTGNAHIAIASQMKRCVLQSNGTVAYYLDPNDSTKKADGTTADLTGATGNVMVEIPKFYYKYEWTGTEHHWSLATAPASGYTVHPAFIKAGVEVNYRYYHAYNPRDNGTKLISASGLYPTTNITRASFRTKAAANGSGWSLVDWNLYFAVQLLYLVEYADFNTQEAIGYGRTYMTGGTWADGSYYAISGLSNANGNNTANVWVSSTAYANNYMSYRGIEHWYGHLWKFVDGVNVNASRQYFVNNKPSTFADDVFTGDYVLKGTGGSTTGYISNYAQDADGLFPSAVTGSATTYVGDYYYQTTSNATVVVGGDALGAGAAGGFALDATGAASGAIVAFSAGLAY